MQTCSSETVLDGSSPSKSPRAAEVMRDFVALSNPGITIKGQRVVLELLGSFSWLFVSAQL